MSQFSHFQSVHFLRGIAALLVASDHLLGRQPYFTWLNDAGDLGVACFFVISGFAIAHSLGPEYAARDFPRFLLRRVLRIEPTYIASIALYCIFFILLSRIAPRASPWWPANTQLLSHIFYLVPFVGEDWYIPAYWSLAVEFQFYLLIGLLFPLLLSVERRWRTGYALCAILFATLALASPLYSRAGLLEYSPFFALGLLLQKQVTRPMERGLFWSTALLITLMAVWAGSGSGADAACAGLATVVIVHCWRREARLDNLLLRAGLFLGTISYSWYVVHTIAGIAAKYAARGLLKFDEFPVRHLLLDALPLASFVCSICAAWLLYLLVERPTHRWARTISLRPNRRA